MRPPTGSHDPIDSVDEGTATGAPTMVLARALSSVFVAARVVADWFGRLRTVLAAVAGAVGRCLQVMVAAVGLPLRAARRWMSMVLRPVWAVVARHRGWIALVSIGALAFPVVPASVDTIDDSGAVWILLLGVILVARMVQRAWADTLRSWIARLGGAIRSTSRRLAERLSSWLTRAAATLGALLGRLAAPARRLVRLVASALERAVQHVAYLRDRVVLSTGVAVARARMTTVGVPATTVELGRRPVGRRDVTSGFTAAVFQNEYLPEGAREAHAVITVTSTVGRDDGSSDSAVVILLDCSGSMGRPWSKLQAARQATAAAIDALAEGTWFAIVRGNDRAEVAYPPSGELVRSTAETRGAAKRALRLLWPEGGTAMGRWLLAAGELFAGRPGAVNRAILLTDGRNESESARSLDDALEASAGRFQCDCRGVGADWSVDELRTISNGLLGTIDVVPEPDLLTNDFEAMAAAAMARGVGEVRLDVQAPSGGSLRHLSQATPEWMPLPLMRSDDGVYRCSTGAWGTETRDFHLTIGLPAGEVGDEMLAAKVSLVVDGRVAARLPVKATWCDDERQPTVMHPAVAHYETQAQLVASIGRGLEAQGVGDVSTAARELGRAAQLAHATDHAATMRLLEAVVDVEDASTGVVRIKSTVDPLEAMTLDARSTRTSAWRGDPDPEVLTDGGTS